MLQPEESLPVVPRVPAPWSLRGHAWMVVMRLPKDAAARTAFVPQALQPTLKAAFSVLICVVYDEAPCGPYRELLFIPGTMNFGDARYPSISRILVSTWDSVVNGRVNWGIPKDRASFDWVRADDLDRWRVTDADSGTLRDRLHRPDRTALATAIVMDARQIRHARAASGRAHVLLPSTGDRQHAVVPGTALAVRRQPVSGLVACQRAGGPAYRGFSHDLSGRAGRRLTRAGCRAGPSL